MFYAALRHFTKSVNSALNRTVNINVKIRFTLQFCKEFPQLILKMEFKTAKFLIKKENQANLGRNLHCFKVNDLK